MLKLLIVSNLIKNEYSCEDYLKRMKLFRELRRRVAQIELSRKGIKVKKRKRVNDDKRKKYIKEYYEINKDIIKKYKIGVNETLTKNRRAKREREYLDYIKESEEYFNNYIRDYGPITCKMIFKDIVHETHYHITNRYLRSRHIIKQNE